MRKMLFSFILVLFFQNMAWADTIGTFKLINGTFKYSSAELKGSSSSMGSPSAGFLKSIGDSHQLGGSFDIFFNTLSQSVSLYGFGLIYKYTFKGQGASITNETSEVKFSTASKLEVYLLSSFKRYSYFLGSNKVDETKFDQTGDFFNFDGGIGTSYNIGHQLRALAEVSTTLYSLAASDSRIKFKSTLVSFGLQKEF
jgi:hypothetical protein